MSEPFGTYENEIYLGGLAGQQPALPLAYEELERRAKETLPPESYDYVAGSASSEDTARANRAAFRRWRIVPRMLTDVSTRDLSTEVLGARMPAPVLLAPIGVQGIIHPDAEVAVARAAAGLGIPIVLSTVSSASMEDVAKASGENPRWFQLYWPNDPKLTASFLSRAEDAGFGAVVVTLDTRILAWRPRDLQRAYLPFLRIEGISNYLSDPVFTEPLSSPPEENPAEAALRWAGVFSDPSQTWEDLAALRERTSLPIVLKGILHPDDARLALEAGIDGIVVSNHGGRQVDGAIAALDALPDVVEAVDGKVPVLFDSGIRTGADAVKAIALGASAVLLGRPYIWGLAIDGEEGVRQVLRAFLADLDLTVALAGKTGVSELDREMLREATPSP